VLGFFSPQSMNGTLNFELAVQWSVLSSADRKVISWSLPAAQKPHDLDDGDSCLLFFPQHGPDENNVRVTAAFRTSCASSCLVHRCRCFRGSVHMISQVALPVGWIHSIVPFFSAMSHGRCETCLSVQCTLLCAASISSRVRPSWLETACCGRAPRTSNKANASVARAEKNESGDDGANSCLAFLLHAAEIDGRSADLSRRKIQREDFPTCPSRSRAKSSGSLAMHPQGTLSRLSYRPSQTSRRPHNVGRP